MVANSKLVKQRNIPQEDVEKINKLHITLDEMVEIMKQNEVESENFKSALVIWRHCQTRLQILWKFDIDQSMWQEHRLPHCKCPKMDNDDRGNHSWISGDCPIHNNK